MRSLRKDDLRLDWCSRKAAQYAVTHWHYSKTMPAGKLVTIGAWEADTFIGSIVFGLGATPNLSKTYHISMQECCELTRVALRTHNAPVSRIVAIALKMLKRLCSGLRLVVSFADSRQGHFGGIYQAGNWIYSGAVSLDTWVIGGVRMHPRSVVATYGTQSAAAIRTMDPTAHKVWADKYRYLMPLDAEMRERVSLLAQPYPKQASVASSDAPAFPAGEGGAAPTPTLHHNRWGVLDG